MYLDVKLFVWKHYRVFFNWYNHRKFKMSHHLKDYVLSRYVYKSESIYCVYIFTTLEWGKLSILNLNEKKT